jgi:cell division inhibitor SulA
LVVAGGWFVPREKYCWLVVDKPNKQKLLNWIKLQLYVALVLRIILPLVHECTRRSRWIETTNPKKGLLHSCTRSTGWSGHPPMAMLGWRC